MKMTVVELQVDGEKCYLVDTSIFADSSTTKNAAEAKNYEGKPEELEMDLGNLVVPGDQVYANSGLRIDALPVVVEVEMKLEEFSRRVGRELRKREEAQEMSMPKASPAIGIRPKL